MLEEVKKGKATWEEYTAFLDGGGSIDEKAVAKMVVQGEGQEVERACVALILCTRNAGHCNEVLPFVEEVLGGTTDPIKVGELFTRFACALPTMLRHVYVSNAAPTWEAAIRLREQILDIMKNSSHPGVIIRGARVLQLITLFCSNRDSGEDEDEEAQVSLDILSLNDDSNVRANEICQLAVSSLDQLISIIWRDDSPSNALLAVVNILGRIARLRPSYLPKIVPALIELFETQPERLSEHQRLHLGHTLEKQLASLVESAAAEKYYSLIVEVLKKSNKYGKKRRSEEDEDELSLANVGTKRIKAESSMDVSEIPLNVIIEVFLISLGSLTTERLKVSLERWRPTAHAQVRDPRRSDPRQPQIQASSIEPDAKVDQMVPFELVPRIIEEREGNQLLLNQYKSILEGMLDNSIIQDPKERKSKLKSLLRLAAVLEIPILGELLVDYWFVNLDERMPTLLYWMRLLWLQGDQQKYKDTYALVLSRLQELAAENSPQWEIYLQRFFTESPEIIGDAHITLLDWLCKHPSTRTIALAIIEQIVLTRPAIQSALVELLVSFCVHEDETLRRAALAVVCDSLTKLKDVADIITKAACDSLSEITLEEEVKSPGRQMDVVLRLLLRRSDVILTKFLQSYNSLDASVQEYCMNQLPLLCAIPDMSMNVLPLCKALLDVPISSDPIGAWIEKLFENLCRNKLLPQECMEGVVGNLLKDKWPIRLLEVFAMVSTKEQLQSALVHYAEVVDPLEEVNKLHYVNLFTKAADLLGPAELFVFLHRLETLSIPLKRCVDVIQICFVASTVFKPDVIAGGLLQLIDLPELPTMLMRTILQSAAHYKTLSSYLVGLLSRLLSRDIWTFPKLWDGFVRCLRSLAPSSYAVMLQLPVERLEEVIAVAPELRNGFLAYLRQQSATIQNRYPPSIFIQAD